MGTDNVHGRIAKVKAPHSYPASVNESETITDAQAFYGIRPIGRPGTAVSGRPLERS